MRFLADETEEELLDHLRRHQAKGLWETTERIMVAVTGAPGTDMLLRRAARMAARTKGELDVLHVATGDASGPTTKGPSPPCGNWLTISAPAGTSCLQTIRPAPSLASPGITSITQIVIGSSQRSRWQEPFGGGSIVRRIIREAGQVGIDVHVIARRALPAGEATEEVDTRG